MLLVVVVLQVVIAMLLVALWLRKPAAATPTDARLLSVPDSMVSLHARVEATDSALRTHMAELRREQGEAGTQARHDAAKTSRELREEITGSITALAKTLNEGLGGFRTDNTGSAEALRTAVQRELTGIGERLNTFFNTTGQHARESQEALHRSLNDLRETNTASHDALREGVQARLAALGDKNDISHRALREGVQQRLEALGKDQQGHQDQLRTSMEGRLDTLNRDNAAKLEQMRVTVDEKLQSTLNERLTQSFGQVTTHLGEVQKGLGEMKELANGVSDLKRVFSNVKARGIVGEFQLGMQLEQMFSREQYEKNARIKQDSLESVEYALKIPQGNGSTALFPIDSKFPREDWERLEHAYEHGSAEEIAKAGGDFERAIKKEGKRICEKYIHEPVTLPHAVMFLPTEGLYAEVMRRPGLQSDLQQNCSVTIAGPSTLMALLTSFRMGFTSLEFERKSGEIREVLQVVRTEFGKFGDLMGKVEKQVGTVQNTLGEIAGKTKTINRRLRDVDALPAGENGKLLSFEQAGLAPLLAASSEE